MYRSPYSMFTPMMSVSLEQTAPEQRALPRWPALLLWLVAGAALAAEPPADLAGRVDLTCTEQPSHEVVFGADGQVSYEEQPPRITDAVPVSVLRTDDKGAYAVDAARIESPRPELSAPLAVWVGTSQVDAGDGRLRLNLTNNVLTLVETDSAGQARFRRFQCEPLPAPSGS